MRESVVNRSRLNVNSYVNPLQGTALDSNLDKWLRERNRQKASQQGTLHHASLPNLGRQTVSREQSNWTTLKRSQSPKKHGPSPVYEVKKGEDKVLTRFETKEILQPIWQLPKQQSLEKRPTTQMEFKMKQLPKYLHGVD